MSEKAIRTGDTVIHKPTGERWLVAYSEGGHVCCCGWPCSLAKVSEVEVINRCDGAYSMELLQELRRLGDGDPRGSYARRYFALANQ